MGCRPFGPGFGAFDASLRAQAMRGPFPPPPCGTNYGPYPHVPLFEWNHAHSDHHDSRRHDEHHGPQCGPRRPRPNRNDFESCRHGPRPWRDGINEENHQEVRFNHHEEEFGQCRPHMRFWNGPGCHGPWKRHEFFEGLRYGPYHHGRWPHGDRRRPFGCGRVDQQSRSPRRECSCDQPGLAGRRSCCEDAGIRVNPCRDRSEGRREKGCNKCSPCTENQETVLVQKIFVDKNPRCYSV